MSRAKKRTTPINKATSKWKSEAWSAIHIQSEIPAASCESLVRQGCNGRRARDSVRCSDQYNLAMEDKLPGIYRVVSSRSGSGDRTCRAKHVRARRCLHA